MPDPTRQNWPRSGRADDPHLSGSAFLSGFSDWLAQEVLPALEDGRATLELHAGTLDDDPDLELVMAELRHAIRRLRSLEHVVRRHDVGVDAWSDLEQLTREAIDACRGAEELTRRVVILLKGEGER